MIVMPANSTGWFWHCLARETGKIGHLYSPGAQRGPWPWFPFAFDNGAFSCWDRKTNQFDESKWKSIEPQWEAMIRWAAPSVQRPRWAIVPDIPGNGEATLERFRKYVQRVVDAEILPAIAVQDGMTVEMVKQLRPAPAVIAIGGSDEFKWSTVEAWASSFKRVHLLRCNSPTKLEYLENLGIESCDGTGWNRGNRNQTAGLERWARKRPTPTQSEIWRYTSRKEDPDQPQLFAV
jgi:hypothetical protein